MIQPAERSPHPLATELASALQAAAVDLRVLLLGVGNGRNVPALLETGARVEAIEDDPSRARDAVARFASDARVRIAHAAYVGPYPCTGGFDGALSTNAMLHGTVRHVAATVDAVRNRLNGGAAFYFTLGSKRDPRFGTGRNVAADTFVCDDGPEAGVAHCYFDEAGVHALARGFVLDSLVEQSAAQTAGAWAHTPEESAKIIHWFVRARAAKRHW